MNFNLEKTYNYLAALICVSIPFMTYAKAFVNICMICLFLIMVVSFNKEKLINIINQKFFKTLAIFLTFIVIYSLFNGSFFDDFSESRKIAQIILLLILFSFVNDKRFLIYGFISGVLVSSLITDMNIVAYYFNSSDLLISKSSVEDLFITQRLYLGFFVVISIVLLSFLFRTSNRNKQKVFCALLILFFIFTLFLISSRSALLIAFLIFLSTIIYESKSVFTMGLILASFVIFSAIIITNKNLSNRFLYSQDSVRTSFIEKIKTHEPRYDIWRFSLQIFEEQNLGLFGLGTYKTQELLVEKYKLMPIDKRKNWFIQRNFNTHNQYIDIILSFGFIGLILFTVFLRDIVLITYKNIYSLNLILSLILFLVIENLFHRQLGSFILPLTIVIAVYIINSQNEKDTSS